MSDSDLTVRPRRPRAKDSFQSELHSKLRERKARGLVADITSEESEEDAMNGNFLDYQPDTLRPQNRPSSAKRRGDHALGSTRHNLGLGDTLRTQDIQRLQQQNILNRKMPTSFDEHDNDDDDDEEIMSTMKPVQSSGIGLSQRKTPPSTQGLFGRKTPVSPKGQELSKEDIIFGRKTPTGNNSRGGPDVSTWSVQQPWQPPNFRNISPTADQQKLAAVGRQTPGLELESINENKDKTPRLEKLDRRRSPIIENKEQTLRLDNLDKRRSPISENKGQTPRLDTVDKRRSPGLSGDSPRSNRPTPRARGRIGLGNEMPVREKEKQKTEKDKQKLHEKAKERDSILDLFGKSRQESSLEVENELKDIEKKKAAEECIQQRRFEKKEERKSPGLAPLDSWDRKSTIGGLMGRKTPTNNGAGLKSPVDGLAGRKAELTESPPPQKKKENSNASLLDFMTDEMEKKAKKPQVDDKDKPQPKERPSRRSTIPKDRYKEAHDIGEVPVVHSAQDLRHSSSQSSFCEDVKEDPNAHHKGPAGDDKKKLTKTLQTKQNEVAIDMVSQEQKRIDFKPVKTIRPVSADAKVVSRPKPRYGTLPGEKTNDVKMPEYNSTLDIRDAVYEAWYCKRMKVAREQEKEKKRIEKEIAEKKKKDEVTRKDIAIQSFDFWQKTKTEELRMQKSKQRQEEEIKKQKEEHEKEQQIKAKEEIFKRWKEVKDQADRLKQKEKAKKEEGKNSGDKNKQEKENKGTAFSSWKAVKDEELKSKHKQLLLKIEKSKTEKEATLRQKEDKAKELYEEWLEAKEQQDQKDRLHKTMQTRSRELLGENDYKPPWIPASHLIPFGSG